MRSEVQVLPGPPSTVQPEGLSLAGRCDRALSGAVAQLGERLLCKQDVVGSIPSGSTNAQSAGLSLQPPRCGLAIARSSRIAAWVSSRDGHQWSVIRKKSLRRASCSPPVLFDIVKRRFVRTSWPQGCDLSQGTLNPLHMMGLPNRALEPISRSWSFCANDIELDPAQDLVQATISSRSRDGYWQ